MENKKMELTIGSKVILRRAMLGESVGSTGFVFDLYSDFDGLGHGAQIIFRGGGLDGFGCKEQDIYLEFVENNLKYSSYEFKNVGQVDRDYRAGYWEF
jgi:hypothetical protein